MSLGYVLQQKWFRIRSFPTILRIFRVKTWLAVYRPPDKLGHLGNPRGVLASEYLYYGPSGTENWKIEWLNSAWTFCQSFCLYIDDYFKLDIITIWTKHQESLASRISLRIMIFDLFLKSLEWFRHDHRRPSMSFTFVLNTRCKRNGRLFCLPYESFGWKAGWCFAARSTICCGEVGN